MLAADANVNSFTAPPRESREFAVGPRCPARESREFAFMFSHAKLHSFPPCDKA